MEYVCRLSDRYPKPCPVLVCLLLVKLPDVLVPLQSFFRPWKGRSVALQQGQAAVVKALEGRVICYTTELVTRLPSNEPKLMIASCSYRSISGCYLKLMYYTVHICTLLTFYIPTIACAKYRIFLLLSFILLSAYGNQFSPYGI